MVLSYKKSLEVGKCIPMRTLPMNLQKTICRIIQKVSCFFAGYPADWENKVRKRVLKRESISDELIAIIVEAFDSGVSEDSLLAELTNYELGGRKITEKQLNNHLSKAKDIIAKRKDAEKLDKQQEKKEENIEKSEKTEEK